MKFNIGKFFEILNRKADKDLSNVDYHKADFVIDYQLPTAENNYTWYRVYKSGWVEQGERNLNWPNPQNSGKFHVEFMIPMRVDEKGDVNYTLTGSLLTGNQATTYEHFHFTNRSSTGFDYYAIDGYQANWMCVGMNEN